MRLRHDEQWMIGLAALVAVPLTIWYFKDHFKLKPAYYAYERAEFAKGRPASRRYRQGGRSRWGAGLGLQARSGGGMIQSSITPANIKHDYDNDPDGFGPGYAKRNAGQCAVYGLASDLCPPAAYVGRRANY